MTDDKLREAAENLVDAILWRDDFWPNNPGVGDDEIVEAVGRLMDERAALADSAPENNINQGEKDGTGRFHERGSDGDRGSCGRNIQGAPENQADELLGAPERHLLIPQRREESGTLGVTATADVPPNTTPDTLVDGEPTEEMVEALQAVVDFKVRYYGGSTADEIMDALVRQFEVLQKTARAALAVQQKGEG